MGAGGNQKIPLEIWRDFGIYWVNLLEVNCTAPTLI
jgi:hypothetical protein